jgi:hypothetical protein
MLKHLSLLELKRQFKLESHINSGFWARKSPKINIFAAINRIKDFDIIKKAQ